MKKTYPKETLHGKRILLKRADSGVSDEIYAVIEDSRDYLAEFLPKFKDIKAEEEKAYLHEIYERWADFESFTYILYIDAGAAGTVSLNKVNFEEKTAEIGYWLGKKFKGKGYMTEAVEILIKEAERLGLKNLAISCDVRNQKSANIAKKLGFIFEKEYFNEKYNRASYLFSKSL